MILLLKPIPNFKNSDRLILDTGPGVLSHMLAGLHILRSWLGIPADVQYCTYAIFDPSRFSMDNTLKQIFVEFW
jgi:hypothetical protein